jgi:tetratricopeptide (TPR) repeat protein
MSASSSDMSASSSDMSASSSGAGSRTTGSSAASSGRAGSGQAGSGQAGSGQAGSGRGGSGHRAQADLDEYLRAAERALTTGEHDLAAKLAAHVLSLAPQSDWRRHAEAHALLGDLAYEQGFLDKSDEAYRTAMLLFEGCGEHAAVGRLLAAVAQTLIGRDRLIDALDLLRAAISRVPDVAVRDSFFFVLQAVGQQAAQQSAQDPPGTTAP